ncbi:NnrS protein [compost metagenome]
MSRASLGHTGRALVASRWVEAAYVPLIGAAILRIFAAIAPASGAILVLLAWLARTGAFGLFAAAYWPVFTGPRLRR